MNNTQSIIVYRNPAEQMFWEGGYAVPLFGALLVLLAAAMTLSHVLPWLGRMIFKSRQSLIAWQKASGWFSISIAAALAIATFNYLMI